MFSLPLLLCIYICIFVYIYLYICSSTVRRYVRVCASKLLTQRSFALEHVSLDEPGHRAQTRLRRLLSQQWTARVPALGIVIYIKSPDKPRLTPHHEPARVVGRPVSSLARSCSIDELQILSPRPPRRVVFSLGYTLVPDYTATSPPCRCFCRVDCESRAPAGPVQQITVCPADLSVR